MEAQQRAPGSIRAGQEVTGRLSESDLHLGNGDPFHAYRLVADSGKRYRISLTSSNFDPAVRVSRVIGPITDVVGFNDDGGENGTDALLVWRAVVSGPYVIVAYAIDGEGGDYALRVTELADPTLVVRSIAVGDSASGFLGERSAVWVDSDAAPYDVYTFRAVKGQRLRPYVHTDSAMVLGTIGQVRNGAFTALRVATDSMSGRGRANTPSALRRNFSRYADTGSNSDDATVIPADGEYAVRVMASTSSDSGAYVLHLLDEGPAPMDTVVADSDRPTAARRAAPNVDLRGRLAGRRGREYWSYVARRGERLTIDVRASGIDPHVYLGVLDDSVFKSITDDDDGGEGLNARLSYVVPESFTSDSLTLLIGVQDEDSRGGPYSLHITSRLPVAHHLQQRPIVAGRDITDELKDTDEIAEDGSAFQEWLYTAKPNERFTVEMISHIAIDSSKTPADTTRPIDTFLSVGRRQGGKFIEYSNNDDAVRGDDPPRMRVARVILDASPTGGEYVIRANTFGPDQHGRYTIRVISGREPVRKSDR